MQTALTERIEGVTRQRRDGSPAGRDPARRRRVGQALDEYFLRYGWPWFPVIDERRARCSGSPGASACRPRSTAARDGSRSARSLEAEDGVGWRIDEEPPAHGGRCPRSRSGELGAVMAVDREGVLRGVVTVDRSAGRCSRRSAGA